MKIGHTSRHAFTLAGIGVVLEGQGSWADRLSALFARCSSEAETVEPEILISWTDDLCRFSVRNETVLKTQAPESLREAVTSVLLTRGLIRCRPDLEILHGNGIVDRSTGSAILLAGDRGLGKTTLTFELCRLRGDLRPFAEDSLLLDATACFLHPFPRAHLLRREPGRPKTIEPFRGEWAESIPLKDSAVIVLGEDNDDARGEAAKPFSCWTSAHSATLEQAIRSQDLSLESCCRDGQTWRWDFARVLDAGERCAFDRLIQEHRALVLAMGHDNEKPEPRERAPKPSIRLLQPGEGIRRLLPHRVQSAPRGESHSGAQVYMRLAALFQDARFATCIPGGTPTETATAILDWLDS